MQHFAVKAMLGYGNRDKRFGSSTLPRSTSKRHTGYKSTRFINFSPSPRFLGIDQRKTRSFSYNNRHVGIEQRNLGTNKLALNVLVSQVPSKSRAKQKSIKSRIINCNQSKTN